MMNSVRLTMIGEQIADIRNTIGKIKEDLAKHCDWLRATTAQIVQWRQKVMQNKSVKTNPVVKAPEKSLKEPLLGSVPEATGGKELRAVRVSGGSEPDKKKYLNDCYERGFRYMHRVKRAARRNRKEGPPCYLCNQRHFLFQCDQFCGYSVKQRLEYVRTYKLCQNCFNIQHRSSECPKNDRCKKCRELHHSMLHDALSKSV